MKLSGFENFFKELSSQFSVRVFDFFFHWLALEVETITFIDDIVIDVNLNSQQIERNIR